MVQQIIELRHRNIDGQQPDIGELGMADAEQALREFKGKPGVQGTESDHGEIGSGRNAEVPRLQ
ncbi:hypothetical protein D3C87_2058100 [compost metagenome]